MKRITNVYLCSAGLLSPSSSLLLLTWLEQVGLWILALGIDWTRLPWAFAGATIATLKSKKDAAGLPIHKPFWEWASSAVGGMIIGLAGWKDVMNYTKFTPELSTVIAGLVGWILADIILKKAKNQLSSPDSTTLKP